MDSLWFSVGEALVQLPRFFCSYSPVCWLKPHKMKPADKSSQVHRSREPVSGHIKSEMSPRAGYTNDAAEEQWRTVEVAAGCFQAAIEVGSGKALRVHWAVEPFHTFLRDTSHCPGGFVACKELAECCCLQRLCVLIWIATGAQVGKCGFHQFSSNPDVVIGLARMSASYRQSPSPLP